MLIPFGVLSAGAAVGGTYELISSTILGGTAASVTFSNLGDYASTYKHLQIRAAVRTTNANNNGYLGARINADTGSNYNEHQLYTDLANSIAVSTSGAFTTFLIGPVAGGSATANGFGSFVADILDFSSTSKNTTVRSLGGYAQSSANELRLSSGLHRNTAAVTSITILERAFSGSLAAGSRFSLYGIRG
jgi:hypothetical protein